MSDGGLVSPNPFSDDILWVFSAEFSADISRIFQKKADAISALGTNKGTYEAMTNAPGVLRKTIENATFSLFDVLAEMASVEGGFFQKRGQIHGVTARSAYTKYSDIIQNPDLVDRLFKRVSR